MAESAGRNEKGQFVKGFTANPGGRPKSGESLTEILRSAGEQPVNGKDRRTRKEALAEKIWAMAISGDWTAINLLLNRLDGALPIGVNGNATAKIALILDDATEGK